MLHSRAASTSQSRQICVTALRLQGALGSTVLAGRAGEGRARGWVHGPTSPLNSHTRDSLWSRNARRSGPMSMLSVSKVALQQTGGSQILLQGR